MIKSDTEVPGRDKMKCISGSRVGLQKKILKNTLKINWDSRIPETDEVLVPVVTAFLMSGFLIIVKHGGELTVLFEKDLKKSFRSPDTVLLFQSCK